VHGAKGHKLECVYRRKISKCAIVLNDVIKINAFELSKHRRITKAQTDGHAGTMTPIYMSTSFQLYVEDKKEAQYNYFTETIADNV